MTNPNTAPLSEAKPDFSPESEAAYLASIWKLSTPQYQRLVETLTRAMGRSRPQDDTSKREGEERETAIDILESMRKVAAQTAAATNEPFKRLYQDQERALSVAIVALDGAIALEKAERRALLAPDKSLLNAARHGIYIASTMTHAYRWQLLRDKVGYPIISTWIDEAGIGESEDLSDLWRRCIAEASSAEVLILNRGPGEVLKGGWVELGAALAAGVPVFAVGIEEFTVAKDKRIRHFASMADAMAALKPMINGQRFADIDSVDVARALASREGK
jgi:hypothetical protein